MKAVVNGPEIVVSGTATFHHCGDFKAWGGRFLRQQKAWAIPIAHKAKVYALVDAVNPVPHQTEKLKTQLAHLYGRASIPDKLTKTELSGFAYMPPDGLVAYAGPTADVESQSFVNGWTYYTRTTGDRTIRVVGFDHS